MSLTSNPFFVLGATPSDDRRRIMALANDRQLDGSEGAIREARSTLLTPRKRLAAEIAWLPGLGREEIRQVLAAKDEHPDAGQRMTESLPDLARTNLMADRLAEADPATVSSVGLAAWIVDLAAAHDRIRADKVTTTVNEARLEAGVPMASQRDVAEELQGRRNHFRDAMERCLDGLPFERMMEVVTFVVNQATQEGACHAAPLIDNLVDSYYERKIRETMAARRREIGKLVSQVRERVGVDVAGLVGQIEREVKAWDVTAQPIQVSLASRGMSHTHSDEVMRELRDLAVDLFNKHGLLEVAHRLIKTLRDVFAEMEPIMELLDKDVSALDGIASNVEATRSQGRDVARPSRPTHATEVHPVRAWYLPGFIILILGVIIATLETSVEWSHTLASTSEGNAISIDRATSSLAQRHNKRDPWDELHERVKWRMDGKGDPDPAWIQESFERGTADGFVTAGERFANFIRSVLQGGMNVPRILLEALGIPTLEAKDMGVGSSWWAWQDPRLRDAFFSSKLPYILGHVAITTIAYVLLIFVGRMAKRTIGREREN